jgi:hypothetical protein
MHTVNSIDRLTDIFTELDTSTRLMDKPDQVILDTTECFSGLSPEGAAQVFDHIKQYDAVQTWQQKIEIVGWSIGHGTPSETTLWLAEHLGLLGTSHLETAFDLYLGLLGSPQGDPYDFNIEEFTFSNQTRITLGLNPLSAYDAKYSAKAEQYIWWLIDDNKDDFPTEEIGKRIVEYMTAVSLPLTFLDRYSAEDLDSPLRIVNHYLALKALSS